MENQKFQAPATITKIVTMADKTIRLQVDCQELLPEEEGKVFSLRHKLGWFLFNPEEVKEEDIKNLPKIDGGLEKNEKSPSQRLHAVLFVYWQQNKITKPYEVFYREYIEKIINGIKEKLN